FFACALAVAMLAPALAQIMSITARPTNVTLKVGQSQYIYVESRGSWPGLAGSTCGAFPHSRPGDTLAVSNLHQMKGDNGAMSFDVKAQHPGTCYLRFGMQAETKSGDVKELYATTHITVTP
ncbi:MAG TPA: hypothetical protein VMB20_02270, partial [Candidatus Acidoferrum sp.]|nr:hypothetical protein [Candidatus Acidoferrum sp.]